MLAEQSPFPADFFWCSRTRWASKRVRSRLSCLANALRANCTLSHSTISSSLLLVSFASSSLPCFGRNCCDRQDARINHLAICQRADVLLQLNTPGDRSQYFWCANAVFQHFLLLKLWPRNRFNLISRNNKTAVDRFITAYFYLSSLGLLDSKFELWMSLNEGKYSYTNS